MDVKGRVHRDGGTQAFSGTGCDTTIAAGAVGSVLRVRGRYIEFDVDAATFSVLNYTLTGAPNALDLTSGVRAIVFASEVPDLRGSTLTSGVEVQVSNDDLLLERAGSAASIKLQAKDCVFGRHLPDGASARRRDADRHHAHSWRRTVLLRQPELPEPAAALPICPPGGPFTKDCYAVAVTPRINFANDVSRRLVGRDSPAGRQRLVQAATVSQWRVASGGRMGGVLGEDSTRSRRRLPTASELPGAESRPGPGSSTSASRSRYPLASRIP